MIPSHITFIHNSDELRSVFSHKDEGRPCFYWFTDRYHSHTGFKLKDKFFYLFVKNPISDAISFRPRNNEDRSFHALYEDFLFYMHNTEYEGYLEPPILMSFSTIFPDLIARYLQDLNEYEIIEPISHRGERFRLFDDMYKEVWAKGIPFVEIPLLNEVIPTLQNSIPIASPDKRDEKYYFQNWVEMTSPRSGTWL